MSSQINESIIYPDVQAAADAVCRKWRTENGYTDYFYDRGSWWAFPPQGVMSVKIHDLIDLAETKATIRIKILFASPFNCSFA